MTSTDEEIASKIIYLKENNFIPNIDNETMDVQSIIRSFYNYDKTYRRDKNEFDEDPFWFRLTFCNYTVTDEFVREINRQYKRFQILNICKGEIND